MLPTVSTVLTQTLVSGYRPPLKQRSQAKQGYRNRARTNIAGKSHSLAALDHQHGAARDQVNETERRPTSVASVLSSHTLEVNLA